MNRLKLYAILEGFDADQMDFREYLARRHGITDPKMQDIWMQNHHTGATQERDPETDLWHELLSYGRELCQDMVLHDIAGFFDTLARRFFPHWLRLLKTKAFFGVGEVVTDIENAIKAALAASSAAERAVDTGDRETPLRFVTRWNTADALPRDTFPDPKHSSSLRGATMLRSDSCYGLVGAIEARDLMKVLKAILSAVNAVLEERGRREFTQDFGSDLISIRQNLLAAMRVLAAEQRG